MLIRRFRNNILLGVVLLFCLLFKDYKVTCYVAAASILLHVIIEVIRGDMLYVKYLWWFVASAFIVVGAFACEVVPIWLAEIASLTSYNGSFNIIAFYYWIFYSVLRLIDPFFEQKTKYIRTNMKFDGASLTEVLLKYGGTLIFVIGLVLFASVMTHPFFAYGVENRFEYAQMFISRWQNVLRTFPPLLAPLTIMPFVTKKRKINVTNILKFVGIPYLPFMLFLIWTGNKYGAYIELLSFIVVPFLMLHRINIRGIIKYGLFVLAIVIGLLLLYYRLKGLSVLDSLYQIALRVAVQAELWWKTISHIATNGPEVSEFAKELGYQMEAILLEGTSKKYGVYHLMSLLADQSIVARYSLIGTRYSATGMELAFYCFGYAGFLLPLIVCPIIAWVNNLYLNSILERRPLCALVTTRIIMLLMPAMAQGDFYAFFSTVPMAFVLLFVVIGMWNLLNAKRKSIMSNNRSYESG